MLRRGSGRGIAANFGNAEDGFPAVVDRNVVCRHMIAKTGGCEGTFGPAIVDTGEVPVYFLGRSISVQLVADVDEMLYYGDINVVN